MDVDEQEAGHGDRPTVITDTIVVSQVYQDN